MSIRDTLEEWYPDTGVVILEPPAMDKAVTGIIETPDGQVHLVYDKQKIVQHFVDEGMTEEEAVDFAVFNTFRFSLCENTPFYMDTF